LKRLNDFSFFGFSKFSSPNFMANEEMICFKLREKKKEREVNRNPVGSWSQGGPLLSCCGSVNGEATLSALMEPR